MPEKTEVIAAEPSIRCQTLAVSNTKLQSPGSSELIVAIKQAKVPFLRENDLQRLHTLDRETLEKIASIARQYVAVHLPK